MKRVLVLALISPVVLADDFVQFNNGSTGWRSSSGAVYGVNGGSGHGSGFNDVDSGERYEALGSSQYVNTRSGQVIRAPGSDPFDDSDIDPTDPFGGD